MTATLEVIAKQLEAGELDKAEQGLKSSGNDAQSLYLKGYLHERRYEYEQAIEFYDQAIELDPEHAEALFRAAIVTDLVGDDDEAIEYYERCINVKPVRVSALLNLAMLYEEQGLLQRAEANLRHVLNDHPNHFRAQHFMDSVESSYSMEVDERSQREHDQRNAVLDVPVTDFELSVRARNCLRQMNIRTLGDLLRVNEPELLSYKNFGETSLNEIKMMLSQKGLRLGQAAERAPEPVRSVGLTPQLGDATLYMNKSVAELELSVRSRKCLQRLGIGTLGELTSRSETELMSIKNFGQTSLAEIKRRLAQFGLSLRMPR